jgi:hypothetical protein
VQIDRGNFLNDFEEAVGLLQLLDLVGEIEFFDDLPRPLTPPHLGAGPSGPSPNFTVTSSPSG